ncbi:MAG: 50S ribosomal protein L10 [Candidatus Levybacteria bacterium]|nr:50S ribosomal protein L10 [Candidatus Levybacteria bacterium]
MPKIKQATKYTGRARKEQIVAELVEKLNNSNGLVFADYKGLTHRQLEDLKKELRKLDSTMIIAKNSLLKLSLGKSEQYADYKNNEGLNLPTATLFIKGDMVEPLRRIQKAIKDFGLPKIKFGVLEGAVVDEAQVLKIASLPARDILLSQFVWTLNSPIRGFATALNATIQKFVMTLNAIVKTKPSPASQGEALEGQTTEPEASSQTPVADSSEPGQTTTQVDQIKDQKSNLKNTN